MPSPIPSALLDKIGQVLVLLARPLTSEQVAEGWTQQRRNGLRAFLERLREKLLLDEPLPGLNLSGGMYHWGIRQGELLELTVAISKDLSRLRTNTQG